MGPNSSLDELALVTASRHVRPENDSVLDGTWSDQGLNNTTMIQGAIAPNNTMASQEVEGATRPEFEINIRSFQSLISNLETARSLESYDPETSVESMEASPTLQERTPDRVRDALESSLLASQAVNSPPSQTSPVSPSMQPITINLFTASNLQGASKVTNRRRTRSLDNVNDIELDMRTFIVHRDQQTVNKRKRGRETANLSTLSTDIGDALNNIAGVDNRMEMEMEVDTDAPSPIAARLRSRSICRRPTKTIKCLHK